MLAQGHFQKYEIRTDIFGVIDCRHDGRTVPECIPHSLCCIFSGFYMTLTFQPCIWIYDWLQTDLYRIFLGKDNNDKDNKKPII